MTEDSSRAGWLRQARSYLRWRPYRSLATSYLFATGYEPAREPAGEPPAAPREI